MCCTQRYCTWLDTNCRLLNGVSTVPVFCLVEIVRFRTLWWCAWHRASISQHCGGVPGTERRFHSIVVVCLAQSVDFTALWWCAWHRASISQHCGGVPSTERRFQSIVVVCLAQSVDFTALWWCAWHRASISQQVRKIVVMTCWLKMGVNFSWCKLQIPQQCGAVHDMNFIAHKGVWVCVL